MGHPPIVKSIAVCPGGTADTSLRLLSMASAVGFRAYCAKDESEERSVRSFTAGPRSCPSG